MKATIVTGIYPPDIGGPATYVPLVKRDYESKGYTVDVVCWGDYHEVTPTIVRISRHQNKIIRGVKTIFHIIKKAGKSDFLFVNNLAPYAVIANAFIRKRLILKVVGDEAWEKARNKNWTKDSIEEFQRKKYRSKISFLIWLNRFFVRKASEVIVPSSYLKDMVTKWGVDKSRIGVVYNQIAPLFKCSLTKSASKKKLGIKGKIILSIGRLVNWKGFDELILMMHGLLRRDKNVKLLIIGDGPERQGLEALITKLKLQQNAKIIGKVNYKDLPAYYRACNLFVLNSEYEGYSHVLLEAAKLGCRIIARDVGGNKEFKENNPGSNVMLVKNTQELKNVVSNFI